MVDISTFSGALAFLQSQGYFVMFLIMIPEGPVITAAAAFAASLGLFNVYIVFLLSVLGQLVGDSVYYSIGRIGRRAIIDKYFKRFGLSKKRMKKIEESLKNNTGKAIAIIKIVPPLPTPGLILAGAANINYKKFILYSLIVSIFYSLLFTLLGFYLGFAFNTIVGYSKYVGFFVVGVIILLIVIWWIYDKYSKKLYKRLEKEF